MNIIASIRHSDPDIDERFELEITSEYDGYAIRTAEGDDAGGYRWKSEAEARQAIGRLWGSEAWDLQWEI